MGQYFYIYNLDKEEYIHPHKFGDGLKLMEFICSQERTMFALGVLMSSGNNRGGGDYGRPYGVAESWAGDRIVISGDYEDNRKYLPENWREKMTLDIYLDWCESEGLEIDRESLDRWINGEINLSLYSHIMKWKDISGEVIQSIKKRSRDSEEDYACLE